MRGRRRAPAFRSPRSCRRMYGGLCDRETQCDTARGDSLGREAPGAKEGCTRTEQEAVCLNTIPPVSRRILRRSMAFGRSLPSAKGAPSSTRQYSRTASARSQRVERLFVADGDRRKMGAARVTLKPRRPTTAFRRRRVSSRLHPRQRGPHVPVPQGYGRVLRSDRMAKAKAIGALSDGQGNGCRLRRPTPARRGMRQIADDVRTTFIACRQPRPKTFKRHAQLSDVASHRGLNHSLPVTWNPALMPLCEISRRGADRVVRGAREKSCKAACDGPPMPGGQQCSRRVEVIRCERANVELRTGQR